MRTSIKGRFSSIYLGKKKKNTLILNFSEDGAGVFGRI